MQTDTLRRSKEWRERAQRVIPGGAQTFSKSPLNFVQGVTPNFVAKAKGAYVWDVDNNCYIDYIMGLGSVILGHCDPAVDEAARTQIEEGVSFSLPHSIEVETAELLCKLIPCAEMVRFGKNGSDVTAAAVRVARAYTKRDKIACCGYHGWQDWYIGSTDRCDGVPEAVRGLTIQFPYNDVRILYRLFQDNRGEIACVIMEPLVFDPPLPGYLAEVKELCHQAGTLLVFDEVKTGFRLALGGASDYFGVTPDIVCIGKAMANGFPLSAIVGRGEVMRLFERVFFSFTFGGEAVSLAACQATIKELMVRQGLEHLWSVGTRLINHTTTLIKKFNLGDSIRCVGLPPYTALRFVGSTNQESLLLRSLFQQETVKRGVLTMGHHMLSVSHNESIVDETLNVYAEAFGVIADAIRNGNVEARLMGAPVQRILRDG